MKKNIVCAIFFVLLMVSYMPTCSSTASGFNDVPDGHWAEDYIQKAAELGIMQGTGDAKFGLGANVTRAQFAAMLTRLFSWDRISPETPTFSDNTNRESWYYTEIETAAAHGAISKESEKFRPDDRITRAEMAVMLVNALGYGTLASNAGEFGMSFEDVKNDRGFITLASDFGIITGLSETVFDPDGYALREQAAAMMIRLHDRYTPAESWTHAFYAISSNSQRDIIARLDGVSFGWSRLQFSVDGGVFLNTTSSGGNEFNIPSGADMPLSIARQNNVKYNLNVFMSTSQTVELSDGSKSNACIEILTKTENRAEAIRQIADAINGEIAFDGVTIDFEEMRQTLALDFLDFLRELKTALGDKELFVCVHPAMRSGGYYDGYKFRELGEICDMVILMAHDYQAKTLTPELMARGFTTTPVTPFEDVYYALKSITDQYTGVEDKSKIALAISIGSVGWSLQNGAVINSTGMRPVPDDIIKRLKDPATVINYSERYRNPFITYYDATDDTDNIVWYEDTRSINDKTALARMFGVTGVSYWRLGLLPDYQDTLNREIYYDVVKLIK